MTPGPPEQSPTRPAASPTVFDVAHRAGVSKSTVSNVLQGKASVAEPLRQRVLEAIDELDYQPHVGARSLRQQSRVIGVVVGDLTNPFHAELAAKVEMAAAKRQHSLLLVTTGGVAACESERVRSLLQHRVAALVFLSAPHRDSKRLLDGSTAVVLASITSAGFAWVAVDEAAGTRAAVAHLAELGHSRIGFVSAMLTGEASTERPRYKGFTEGVREAGLTLVPEHVLRPEKESAHVDSWFDRFRAYVRQPHRPTAIVAAHDLMALELLAAAEAEGLRVPEDLSIVGFDNIAIARWHRVALTTIAQPMDEIAAIAVDMALRMAREPRSPRKRVKLAPSLIVRRTTGQPAGIDRPRHAELS
jgi:LacI family transcriptional regulator